MGKLLKCLEIFFFSYFILVVLKMMLIYLIYDKYIYVIINLLNTILTSVTLNYKIKNIILCLLGITDNQGRQAPPAIEVVALGHAP